jgi:hypothetical protein
MPETKVARTEVWRQWRVGLTRPRLGRQDSRCVEELGEVSAAEEAAAWRSGGRARVEVGWCTWVEVRAGGGRAAARRESTGGRWHAPGHGRGSRRAVSVNGRPGASLRFEQKWWHATTCGGKVPTFFNFCRPVVGPT